MSNSLPSELVQTKTSQPEFVVDGGGSCRPSQQQIFLPPPYPRYPIAANFPPDIRNNSLPPNTYDQTNVTYATMPPLLHYMYQRPTGPPSILPEPRVPQSLLGESLGGQPRPAGRVEQGFRELSLAESAPQITYHQGSRGHQGVEVVSTKLHQRPDDIVVVRRRFQPMPPGVVIKTGEAAMKTIIRVRRRLEEKLFESLDVEKIDLGREIIKCDSEDFFTMLDFKKLLHANTNKEKLPKLTNAISILEKYCINLLKEPRPVLWRTIKMSNPVFVSQVACIEEWKPILKQIGYEVEQDRTLTFPQGVFEPDTEKVKVMAIDLYIAICVVDALVNDKHPLLYFDPSIKQPAPQVEPPAPPPTPRTPQEDDCKEQEKCCVCDEPALICCTDCNDLKYCLQCDYIWHSHPKRKEHKRGKLITDFKPPVPAPRQKKPQPAPRSAKDQPVPAPRKVVTSTNPDPATSRPVNSSVNEYHLRYAPTPYPPAELSYFWDYPRSEPTPAPDAEPAPGETNRYPIEQYPPLPHENFPPITLRPTSSIVYPPVSPNFHSPVGAVTLSYRPPFRPDPQPTPQQQPRDLAFQWDHFDKNPRHEEEQNIEYDYPVEAWSCEYCTFVNKQVDSKICEMCSKTRRNVVEPIKPKPLIHSVHVGKVDDHSRPEPVSVHSPRGISSSPVETSIHPASIATMSQAPITSSPRPLTSLPTMGLKRSMGPDYNFSVTTNYHVGKPSTSAAPPLSGLPLHHNQLYYPPTVASAPPVATSRVVGHTQIPGYQAQPEEKVEPRARLTENNDLSWTTQGGTQYPEYVQYSESFPFKQTFVSSEEKPAHKEVNTNWPNYKEDTYDYEMNMDERTCNELYVDGLEYVRLVREAENNGFEAEELNVATFLGWEDPLGPIHWLKTEWSDKIVAVIGLAVSRDKDVGNITTKEAREALIEFTGDCERAVQKCIKDREEKISAILENEVYSRTDINDALDKHSGDVELALEELERKALEPILRKILNNPITDEEEGASESSQAGDEQLDDALKNKDLGIDKRIRMILAEFSGIQSWGRAETAVKLIDLGHLVSDSVEAAKNCGDLTRSLRYLENICPFCADTKPVREMFTFFNCQDAACESCVSQYLTLVIKDKSLMHLHCPTCEQPNLDDEALATEYFNKMDIAMRRGLVDAQTHNLFQQKLRDLTLMKEPNFRWCSHCSSGFINEQPDRIKMTCPHCAKHTCFNCKKQWEDQHEGISCEQFAEWQEANDPEFQAAGLAAHLKNNGIECPKCKFRYDLAKGGCMHFKCTQCSHEFCSGCYCPFRKAEHCNVSERCATMGFHAHHPRDCLFYLRDRKVEELQKLLTDNGVDFDTEPQVPANEIGSDEDEPQEVQGAFGGGHCKVKEQKETGEGLLDAECGDLAPPGYAGLCKLHYSEYLVNKVNDSLIDPADIMQTDELTVVLSRGNVPVPNRLEGEGEDVYHERLLAAVKQMIPLPELPPRGRVLQTTGNGG